MEITTGTRMPAFLSMHNGSVAGTGTPGELAPALLAALGYSDLFDYPLSLKELYRYQVGTRFTESEVARAITGATSAGMVTEEAGFYALAGREAIFEVRRKRGIDSARIWRRAKIYTHWLANAPLVRMVAVTGALAVDNIAERPDIDLLVVTRPGRVWVCRRLLVMGVRLARLFGDDLCPNYLLSETRLDLEQRDFFTAHELAQMVPVHGKALYGKMLRANRWAEQYLPMAFRLVVGTRFRRRGRLLRAAELVLGAKPLDRWERWEMRRLRSKLTRSIGESAEVVCTPEQCKGHTGLHRTGVTARFRAKLEELGLDSLFAPLLEEETLGAP